MVIILRYVSMVIPYVELEKNSPPSINQVTVTVSVDDLCKMLSNDMKQCMDSFIDLVYKLINEEIEEKESEGE